MQRATGNGKVEIDDALVGPGLLKALLYNFDFDDMKATRLKPEHEQFLDEQVVPLLENDSGQIWLEGSASRINRSGKSDYNHALSQVRVDRVATHLANRGVGELQMQTRAIGSTKAAAESHVMDDERDRSVTLTVMPKRKNAPPPPRRVPPKPKLSNQFSIAMLMGLSASRASTVVRVLGMSPKFARLAGPLSKILKGKVSAGLAVDVLWFDIWDTKNNLLCGYIYIGAGAGVGATHLPPLTGTKRGPWNPFTTSAEISSSQFEGFTRFTTAGALDWSVNYLHLEGTPPGVQAVHMQIDTGTTIGLGMSFTFGDLLLYDGPTPFTGP